MAEKIPEDLESLVRMLELRIQNLVCRFESSNTEIVDLRNRMESVEAWRSQIQESGNFGADRRDMISETSTKFEGHGDRLEHDKSVSGNIKSECLRVGEVTDTVESEKEVDRLSSLVENLEEKLTEVSPPNLFVYSDAESREKEDIQEAGKSTYPGKGREELTKERTKKDNFGQFKVSENIGKVKHLHEYMKNADHFTKGTAFRGIDEVERESKGAKERQEVQVVLVGKENKPDVCIQGGKGFLLVEESQEVLEKTEAKTDETLTDDCLKEGKDIDYSACQLIEESQRLRVGQEAKEIGIQTVSIKGDETLKVKKDVDEVGMEDDNDPGMNAGKEMEKLMGTQNVGIYQKLGEFSSKYMFHITEMAKVADEVEETRMEEGSSDDFGEAFGLERKNRSENSEQEFEKFENIRAMFVKGKKQTKFSEKASNKEMPKEIPQDVEKWTRGTAHLIEEVEKLNLTQTPLNFVGAQEEENHDYELELKEMEESLGAEFDTPEELDSWFSEESSTQKGMEQSKVEDAMRMILNSIEIEMNIRLPLDLRNRVGSHVRNLIDSSQMDLKRKVQQVKNMLLSETSIRYSFQAEIRRLYQELIKRSDYENSYKDKIHDLHEVMNAMSNEVQSYKIGCRELSEQYNILTLNVEEEMKRHREMCEKYKKLTCENDSLKIKCAKLASVVDISEVDIHEEFTENGDSKECDEPVVTRMEENFVSLSRSLSKLKDKVLHVLEVQPLVLERKKETVDSSEALDDCCKELLQYLKNNPTCHVRMIEEMLKMNKKKNDYLWTRVFDGLKLTLHQVVRTESPLLTGLLLEYGVNCHAVDENGNTALHIAAVAGNFYVARVLLQAGCSANAVNSSKLTPLYLSLYYGHVNFSLLLIWSGANPYLRDDLKVTPLHLAVLTGNLVAVQAILERGADVNAADVDGDTPLFNAAIIGDIAIGTLLVSAGAVVTALNGVGSIPLHVAAWEGNHTFCTFLLNFNSPVDPINLHNVTPLHLAAMEDHALVVQLLVNRGARVNTLEDNTESPLHYAVKFGNLLMAKSLIRAGANILATNCHKFTPLHYAVDVRHKELCLLLLQKKSDVNAADIRGKTPLHHVAGSTGDIETAKILVSWGADMTAIDCDGLTPSDLASKAGNSDFCLWLEKQIETRYLAQGREPRRKRNLKH